jgi:hypothetical protein
MAKTVAVIGVEPAELTVVRSLLAMLRHPDPVTREMTRRAILYLEANAAPPVRAASLELAV